MTMPRPTDIMCRTLLDGRGLQIGRGCRSKPATQNDVHQKMMSLLTACHHP
jgi:hypothetical protein